MKTAQEWDDDDEIKMLILKLDFQEIYKRIQLDAWKQGMIDAANIAVSADCKSVASQIDLERDKEYLFTYNCE